MGLSQCRSRSPLYPCRDPVQGRFRHVFCVSTFGRLFQRRKGSTYWRTSNFQEMESQTFYTVTLVSWMMYFPATLKSTLVRTFRRRCKSSVGPVSGRRGRTQRRRRDTHFTILTDPRTPAPSLKCLNFGGRSIRKQLRRQETGCHKDNHLTPPLSRFLTEVTLEGSEPTEVYLGGSQKHPRPSVILNRLYGSVGESRVNIIWREFSQDVGRSLLRQILQLMSVSRVVPFVSTLGR